MQKPTLRSSDLKVSAISLGCTAGQQADDKEDGDGSH